MTPYARTFHFVGQGVYEIGGDQANGEVYCLAHHLTADRHGGTSYVMHMRRTPATTAAFANEPMMAEFLAGQGVTAAWRGPGS